MSATTEPQATITTTYPLRVEAIEAYHRALREGFDVSRDGRTVNIYPTTAETKARRHAPSQPSDEAIREEAVRRVDARHRGCVPLALGALGDEYDRETLHVASLARQHPWDQVAPTSWRIFDADAEEVTEEPVNESAARFEFDRTRKLNPGGRFELHSRDAGGEWEVVC